MAQEDFTSNTRVPRGIILSEYKEITTLLRKPVKDKRRIKYTCLNVSKNYIALGSTSGGIYLFARESCLFQQLIPLSNGAVTHVLISPDEKVIALSTTDGNVCLVVFKPTIKEAIISSKNERNSERVSTLCWNDNSTELYIGDTNGTIHVMGLSIFTVKRGIFQDPACPIMNLDYKIVQMDFCSPLLLISTLSNCYICDTVEGQYEKVGVRTRQGEFGACFYRSGVKEESEVSLTQQKHSPSGNTEQKEAPVDPMNGQYQRIYSARPGSRLWEARANGKIVKTHNFKDALAIPPSIIHKRNGSEQSCIEDSSIDWPPQSLKFSPLYVLANEYLFTYNSNALYILDPVNSAVILWSNEHRDVAVANVFEKNIYLMKNSGDFHCLELNAFPAQNKNDLSSISNSGIVVVNSRYSSIKRGFGDKDVAKFNEEEKIESLNKQNLIGDVQDLETINESLSRVKLNVDYINGDGEENRSFLEKKGEEDNLTSVRQEEKKNSSNNEISSLINDVQIIYTLANSISGSMSDDEIDGIIEAVQKVVTNVKESYDKLIEPRPIVLRAIQTAEQYYRNIFLSKLEKNKLIKTESENILNQMMNSFVRMNVSDLTECECGFPHPYKKFEEPKFFDIGTVILKRYSNDESQSICVSLCKKVPYMWRIYVAIYSKRDNLFDERIFAQCLQTRDDLILSHILPQLNPNQWEFAMKVIDDLNSRLCLSCNRPIQTSDNQNDLSINWNNVANEIMKREGPDVTVNFLTTIVTILPSLSLNKSLFQSLIFTKILNNHGLEQPVAFNQKLNLGPCDKYSSLCCPEVQDQLLKTLEKDLTRPLSKHVFGSQAHHWGMRYDPADSVCPCCTLPLHTPVLLDNNGLTLFPCGHTYHVNCLIQKKILKCNLHP